MNLTYRDLRDYINTLTEQELDLNVSVYSGDVDECFPVFGTSRNTDEEMGEKLDTLDPNHPMLLI